MKCGVIKNEEIENEELYDSNELSEITEPFDPTLIDVDIAVVNLGSVIEDIEDNDIELQPDFQRSDEAWDIVRKSRLIESILLGLPLPAFYFSEDPLTNKRVVIDGLQRLTAIKDFVLNTENPLKLKGLQFLHKLEGKVYEELGRGDKKRIKSLKITINTLRKTTPSNVKFVIFQRVNSAGVPLTSQEMRHALYQGKATKFLKELANLQSFKDATDNTISSSRMLDRDFVNRFLAFYIAFDEYKGDLDSFMSEALNKLNNMSDDELNEIQNIFDKSMKCCYSIFGADCFRKRLKREDGRYKISKAIFDTLSVNVAKLTTEEQEILIKEQEHLKNDFMELCNNKDFDNSISKGTAKISSIKIRFSEIERMINKYLSKNDN